MATKASPRAVPPAISGAYRGFLTASGNSSKRLDLRIDVDARITNSPAMQRVSGDLFRVDKNTLPGQPPKTTEVYQESWILEAPQIKVSAEATVITGTIRYWNGVHPKTNASIRIPRQPADAPAEVTLQRQASPPMTFSCAPAGKFFRSVRLEIDVCKSVNVEPILPTYGTHGLKQRPPGLADRVLTIDRAYGEAGVELILSTEGRTVIDDSAPAFETWSDAELHNAMEHHFSRYQGRWPKWELWGLVAGQYDDDLVGGVMFDYAAAAGGAGNAPERQGFAVFRRHEWFQSLVAKPQTPAEFEAARKFLWTFTHEAGHAFNMVHSFEKSREDALSWMNYDWQYDSRHGDGAYWAAFPFRFDDEELLHIRHGNRSSVIMGGDPWGAGGHAESPPAAEMSRVPPGAMVSVSGEVPLEIMIRAQPYFEFLEPVSVEIRARNVSTIPVTVNFALHPEHGSVSIYIRRPDGRVVEYIPISCKLAQPRTVTLSPAGTEDGSDRHSRSVFVSYGRYGFYFDEPGQYLLRAVYHGPGNIVIPSEPLRVRVGHPKSERADRIAQDFFSYESGTALYLGGSHSTFLAKGMDTLLSMIDEQKTTLAGAKTAARIARGVGMPFHDLAFDEDQASLKRATKGETKEALRLTDVALKIFRKLRTPALNISIERASRTKAEVLIRIGDHEQARDEMNTLANELEKAGVKQSVVAKVESDAATIKVPRRRTTTKKKTRK